MRLAHFEGCMNDVNVDYAIDIATVIAIMEEDEQALTLCDLYMLCKDRNLHDNTKIVINKLKEHYKNVGNNY